MNELMQGEDEGEQIDSKSAEPRAKKDRRFWNMQGVTREGVLQGATDFD